MLSRLHRAVLTAALALAVVSVESRHRIEIVPQATAAPADPCADAAYRTAMDRVMFFDGGFVNGSNGGALAERPGHGPGCSR